MNRKGKGVIHFRTFNVNGVNIMIVLEKICHRPIRISSDKAGYFPKWDVRFILLK